MSTRIFINILLPHSEDYGKFGEFIKKSTRILGEVLQCVIAETNESTTTRESTSRKAMPVDGHMPPQKQPQSKHYTNLIPAARQALKTIYVEEGCIKWPFYLAYHKRDPERLLYPLTEAPVYTAPAIEDEATKLQR